MNNHRDLILNKCQYLYNLYNYDFNGNIYSININFRWNNYDCYTLDQYVRETIFIKEFIPHIIIEIPTND